MWHGGASFHPAGAAEIQMTVLRVFGQNLRQLCKAHSSQANVALQLGIGKVQFQRYLNGSSFPKPNMLARVCDFFRVDARVLTEPLSEDLMRDMAAGQRSAAARTVPGGLVDSLARVKILDRAFEVTPDFPDGLYQFWYNSFRQPGTIICMVVQVAGLGQGRTMRGHDPKVLFGRPHSPERQLRGAFGGPVLRQTQGYSVIMFHRQPVIALSHVFLSPVPFASVKGAVLFGISSLGLDEVPGMNRVTRVVWQEVGPSMGERLAAARATGRYLPADVAPMIRSHLQMPLT